MWGSVPGGYRATANDNIVLILMIETIEGVKNAHEIAKIPGVDALFAASGDLGNFSGFAQGSPDYERLINVVHDAAHRRWQEAVRTLSPGATDPTSRASRTERDGRHRARGCRRARPAADTQGKVEVGPFAAPSK